MVLNCVLKNRSPFFELKSLTNFNWLVFSGLVILDIGHNK